MDREDAFFIGELARRSGTTRDTIRYYESAGVLPEPPRSDAGYRLYGEEAVKRLRFVDQAKVLGLTLDQIADVVVMVDQEREPCRHVRRALTERLSEIRRRIRELRELETRLDHALSTAEDEPGTAGKDCRCWIIEEAGTAAAKPSSSSPAP